MTQLQSSRGEAAEARRSFELAARADPQDARVAEARRLLVRAAGLDRTGAAHLALGLLEQRRRAFPEAREAFSRGVALAAGPVLADIYRAWGLMERSAAGVEAGRRLLEEGAKRCTGPPAGAIWYALALLERSDRNFPAARRVRPPDPPTRAILSTSPPPAAEEGAEAARRVLAQGMLWRAWGDLEARRGRAAEAGALYARAVAAASFERAAELDPGGAQVLLWWGEVEAGRGELERARGILRRAADADPHLAAVFEAWAGVEERLGRAEAAERLRSVARAAAAAAER
eukprot:tig00020816_g14203.t1